MARITFLGVGGWISEPFLGFTSIMIEHENQMLLIDAGEGVYRALRYCGYDLPNLKAIVITHNHGDHILGLPTIVLMSARRMLGKVKVISMKNVLNAMKLLFKAIGMEELIENVDSLEVSPSTILSLGVFRLSFIEARHTIPALSVKISVNDRCIVFSGDTTYNPALAEFAKNCDVLIHEVANYDPNAYIYGHTNYAEAIDIATKANVRMLIPIHFYQQPMPIDLSLFNQSYRPKIYIPTTCSSLEV